MSSQLNRPTTAGKMPKPGYGKGGKGLGKGGVTHNRNQTRDSILGVTSLPLDDWPEEVELREFLLESMRSAERRSDTSLRRFFVTQQPTQFMPTDIQ